MLSALALATVLVQPGNTLSQIAVNHGVSLSSLEGVNPQIANYNLIYPGESINLPAGASAQAPGTPAPAEQSAPAAGSQYQPAQAPASSYSSPSSTATVTAPATTAGGTAPSSFQSCVIQRESGGDAQVMNSSGHYGLYQFSASTWAASGGNPADFGHASVAEQNQVFENAYAQFGTSPWAPYDGC